MSFIRQKFIASIKKGIPGYFNEDEFTGLARNDFSKPENIIQTIARRDSLKNGDFGRILWTLGRPSDPFPIDVISLI